MKNILLIPQPAHKPAPGTLLDAIYRRHTDRLFSPKPLSAEHLSQILWVAYGINRPDGHRTVPSAMALYPLRIFAFLPEGVYLYNPVESRLEAVAEGDHRAAAGLQDFVAGAPLNLVIYSDYNAQSTGDPHTDKMMEPLKTVMSSLDAGAVAENVYLYCSSEGINVVERMMVDSDTVGRLLSLPDSYHFQVALTVGYGA